MTNDHETRVETKARQLDVCPGCGEPKQVGCIVCWNCFKYVPNPFKYANMSLTEWLKVIPANEMAQVARAGL